MASQAIGLIRDLQLSDIGAAAKLVSALFAEHDNPCSVDQIARGLKRAHSDPDYGRYYVAEFEGQLIGVVALKRLAEISVEPGYIGWIDDWYVDRLFRKQGVGEALLQHVAEQALCGGYSTVRAWVKKGNYRARTLFEKVLRAKVIGWSIEIKL